MKSAASPALGLPLGADKKIAPVRTTRKRLRRVPQQWAVATWSRGLSAEAAAGALRKLTHAGRGILRAAWDAMELESLDEMTFGVSQLATLPGVTASSDTVLRTMRRLVEVFPDAADLVETGCRGRGHQSVWKIRRPQTTWSTSRRVGIERRRAFRKRLENPQSASLPSRKSKSISSETTPTVPPNPKRKVDVAQEGIQEDQMRLQEALQAPEGPKLNPGGAKTVAAAVTPQEARRLVEAGRGFLEWLFEEIRPQATKSPQALLVARLKSPTFRREILASAQAYIRRRDIAIAAGDVASLNPGDLSPAIVLVAWKTAAKRVPPASFAGYSSAYDLERSAWKACLAVARLENPTKASQIEAAVGSRLEAQGIRPGSLIWSRAFAHHLAKDLAEATPWLRDASASPTGQGDRASGRKPRSPSGAPSTTEATTG